MPRCVAHMRRENIANESAESLAVHNVKTSAQLQRDLPGETENRSQCIRTPSWHLVEVNARRAVVHNPVCKNMDFMFPAETSRQFRHVTAVPARTMIIVHHKGNPHPAVILQRI